MVANTASNDEGSLPAAAGWIEGLMHGSLALTVSTLAIGLFGLAMLSGRVSIKAGARVVLGCFILLGSSTLAHGLLGLARDTPVWVSVKVPVNLTDPAAPPAQPPASPAALGNVNPFDPYANQSASRKVEQPAGQ